MPLALDDVTVLDLSHALALCVVCMESIDRPALQTMTRGLNEVDDKEIAGKVAQEHDLTANAPSGSKEHALQ